MMDAATHADAQHSLKFIDGPNLASVHEPRSGNPGLGYPAFYSVEHMEMWPVSFDVGSVGVPAGNLLEQSHASKRIFRSRSARLRPACASARSDAGPARAAACRGRDLQRTQ